MTGMTSRRYVGNPLAISGETLRLDQGRTPSRLLLFARKWQQKRPVIDVVAVVELENYLLGVLAGEMPARWPLEALKAQAVASRSYALFQRLHNHKKPFHLESTVMDQVYDYKAAVKTTARLRKKIERAVSETKGLALFNSRGNVIQAFYHADCGGHTEEPHDVWSNGLKLGAKKDNVCPKGRYASWTTKLSERSLGRMFFGGRERVKKFDVLERTGSGRVRLARLVSSSGKERLIRGTKIRSIIGVRKLRSTLFQVHKESGRFALKGRGFGHGAGMCQWGTKRRAQRGDDFRSILANYYPRAKLKSLLSRPMLSGDKEKPQEVTAL